MEIKQIGILSKDFWPLNYQNSRLPDHAVAMPHAKTSTLDRTFLHSAIRIWNTLPDTVVGKIKSDSVQSFKQRVNKHMLFDG